MARRVLEEIDYVELYQKRPPASIDEAYLWSRLEPLLLSYMTNPEHVERVSRWHLAPSVPLLNKACPTAAVCHLGIQKGSLQLLVWGAALQELAWPQLRAA